MQVAITKDLEGKKKFDFERFDKLKRMDYEEKVTYSKKLIEKAYEVYGDKLSVSCSFGKDSMVVLHMALEVNPDIVVLWANTGVEYPETVKFARKIAKEWDLNLVECKPIKTYWECVREYGFPLPRKIKLGDGYKAPGTPRCCYYMKEKPLMNKIHELGLKATMTGLTWDESYNRKWLIVRRGDWFFVKKRRYWMVHPVAYWNSFEIWMYIEDNSIPVNPMYDKIERIGCKTCTAFLGWEKQMARVNPNLYRFIMRKMREMGDPRGMHLLDDFFEI